MVKLGSTTCCGHLAWVLWYEHRQGCLPRAKLTMVSYPWGVLCLFQCSSGFRGCHSLGATPFILQSCRHGVNRTIAHNAGPWRNLTVAGVRQVVRFSWRYQCITWMREGNRWDNRTSELEWGGSGRGSKKYKKEQKYNMSISVNFHLCRSNGANLLSMFPYIPIHLPTFMAPI